MYADYNNQTHTCRHRAQDRIPTTLQAVFLASNRGHDVHLAPPDKAASKAYFKNNVFCGTTKKQDQSIYSVFGEVNKQATISSRQNNGRAFQRSNGKNQRRLPVSLFSPSPHKAATTKSESGPKVPTQIIVKSPTRSPKKAAKPSVSPQSFQLGALQLGDSPKSVSASPHDFLTQQLKERGYSTYDVYLIGQVRAHQPEGLMEMIQCGLSPNPCNSYGESLVHTVARFGNYVLLSILLDHGCSVQVSDDYGRTPLHDAFWAARPSFETVELLLQQDSHLLFLSDARGNLPLDYVRNDDWGTWITFLRDRLDVFWPVPGHPQPSPLMTKKEGRLPLANPGNALPVDVARLVASGRIKPEEAVLLINETDDDSDFSETDEDDESSSYDDPSESEDDSFAEATFRQRDDDSFAEYKEVMRALDRSCANFRSSASSKATCL